MSDFDHEGDAPEKESEAAPLDQEPVAATPDETTAETPVEADEIEAAAHADAPAETAAPVEDATAVVEPTTTRMPLATITTKDGDASEEDVESKLAYDSLMRHRKQQRRKKVVRAVVIVAVLVVLGVVWYLNQKPTGSGTAGSTIPTATVTREDFEDAVSASGSVKPVSSVIVSPEVDGIIDQVNVQEGSVVNAGDTLFTIKNDELDKNVKQAGIDLQTAKNTANSAYSTYSTAYNAYYNGTGEEQAMNDAYSAYENAALAQQTAQSNYDSAVAQAAKRTVTAPSSGSVVTMNAVSGASLGTGGTSGTAAGSPLIQIADLSQMTVTVQVNESDISKIAVNQAATVTFAALPGVTLDATVTHISTMSSDSSSQGGTGIVTYAVDLLIPHPVAELKPGMTASVSIKLQSVPDALTVPTSALVQVDDSTYCVYVVTNAETGESEERDVTVVAKNASTAAIEGNVSEGDAVQLLGYSDTTGSSDGAVTVTAGM